MKFAFFKRLLGEVELGGGSRVAPRYRDRPPMWETPVWSLVREDSTCLEQTSPCAQPLSLCSRARELQLLKSTHAGACAPQREEPPQ